MYESHWQLDRRPFENGLEPGFYYPGETHQGALLKLRYVLENQRGAAVLAGPSGCGKTLLVQMLKQQLPARFSPFVHLVFPQMTTGELLAYIAGELGTTIAPPYSVDESVRQIQQALVQLAAQGRHAVIAVDEAHLLDDTHTLEALRLLLNFETGTQPGLTLLLIGQPALLPILDRMPGLEERMGVKCLLRPLTLEETISYVTHRLQAAGAKRTIFEPDALETLYHLTGGLPRRINRLCDLALLIGYAEERQMIPASQLEAVHEELVSVAPE